jgi:hypothetical protein
VGLAAVRLTQRGASVTTLIILVVGAAATAAHLGPFAKADDEDPVVSFQAFLTVLSVAGLVLAAAMSERNARERALQEANGGLTKALEARDTFIVELPVRSREASPTERPSAA